MMDFNAKLQFLHSFFRLIGSKNHDIVHSKSSYTLEINYELLLDFYYNNAPKNIKRKVLCNLKWKKWNSKVS